MKAIIQLVMNIFYLDRMNNNIGVIIVIILANIIIDTIFNNIIVDNDTIIINIMNVICLINVLITPIQQPSIIKLSSQFHFPTIWNDFHFSEFYLSCWLNIVEAVFQQRLPTITNDSSPNVLLIVEGLF